MLVGDSAAGISGDKTQNSRGSSDWIVRIDENGTKLWDKRFGGSSQWYERNATTGMVFF